MDLTVYGVWGSSPCPGGNTSCFKLESKGAALILDAGSGLLGVPPEPANILLSHLHLDHIIGLSFFGPNWVKDGGVKIFTQSRANNKSMVEQVFGVFRPPYWPVPMAQYATAEVIQIHPGVTFSPDGIFQVTPFDASHPDLTTSFKITDGDKTLIYLLDYEMATLPATAYTQLVENCNGADLIIFDANYHPRDYETHRGYGHSTPLDGIRLADACGAGRMLFTHFSPVYQGAPLESWPELLDGVENPGRFLFARDGMEITL